MQLWSSAILLRSSKTSGAADDVGLLGAHARGQLVVGEDVELRPRRRHARRVLAGEEQGDEQPRDLVVGRLGAVLVDHVDEDLQDVGARRGLLRRLPPARLDHVAEELHHLQPRGIALPVALDGRRRPEERERRDALVEVVVDLADLGEEILAHVVAVEAPRGREDRQLRQRHEEIGRAALAPLLGEVGLRLPQNLGHVRLQPVRAQAAAHVHVLRLALRRRRVVDHAFSEDLRHEAVDLGLAEHVVAVPEERRDGLGPHDERQAFGTQRHRERACAGATRRRGGARDAITRAGARRRSGGSSAR